MSDEARKIRAYQDSDKQVFLEIYDAAIPPAHYFLEESVLLSQRQSAENLLNQDWAETFVLEDNREIVGFATFINESAMAGFFIDPNRQGVGLGKYFMEHIQHCKQTIELAVYEKNQKAVRFYQHNNFMQTGKKVDESSNEEYLEMVWNI